MNNYRFCNSANSVKFHEQEDELQKIIVLKTRLNPGKNHLPILHLQRRTVNHLLQNNSFDCFEPSTELSLKNRRENAPFCGHFSHSKERTRAPKLRKYVYERAETTSLRCSENDRVEGSSNVSRSSLFAGVSHDEQSVYI